MRKASDGYTIMELLVVMAVLGILATAAMPMAELVARRGKERELKLAVWEIRHAIDVYKQDVENGHIAASADASGYPPTLEVLAEGIADLKGAQTIYLLRRIPRDPFAPATVPAAASWGVRSYSSSAEQPKAGADVFDVFSQSDQIGINGVPYRLW